MRIKRRHEEYKERRGRQLEALQSLEGKNNRTLPQELEGLSLQDRKRMSYDQRPTLDARAHENHSLAARLAQREIHRRDTARRSTRQHGVSEEEEQERRVAGTWESWQNDLAQQGGDSGDLSNQLQEVARLQQNGHRTSYSSVSCAETLLTSQLLTTVASNITIRVHLPLSLSATQISSRKMV